MDRAEALKSRGFEPTRAPVGVSPEHSTAVIRGPWRVSPRMVDATSFRLTHGNSSSP